jgi:hypothetical protein
LKFIAGLSSFAEIESTARRKQVSMHLCQPSRLSSSVRCPVCGQGFLIYAEQGIDVGHSLNRRTIQHVLRTHHTTHSATSSAHPEGTFHIPNWSGAQPLLASAALSNLLDNAL